MTEFRGREHWDPTLRTIPEYAFGMLVDPATVVLSAEYDELEWLTVDAANARLEWQSNRVALQELHAKLVIGTHTA